MQHRRREQGQGLIEFSMTLPLLMLLILGIMECSMMVFSYNTIANAAREGSRAAVRPSASDQQIINATLRLTTGTQLTADDIAISRPTSNTVRVEITYALNLITGTIIQAVGGNPTIVLYTSSTMSME